MLQHSRISSRFLANKLNSVNSHMNLDSDIPLELEYKAGKEVIVPLSLVVA
jgi:hypothetical protein